MTNSVIPKPRFKTWRTVKLGGFKSADEIRKALKKQKCFRGGSWEDGMMDSLDSSLSSETTEIELVLVSTVELGFRSIAKCKAIFDRAQELGLDLCPAEVGPQLRLQYKDQPEGHVVIGMEPVAISDGPPCVFYVLCHKGKRQLTVDYATPDRAWFGETHFVFVRQK